MPPPRRWPAKPRLRVGIFEMAIADDGAETRHRQDLTAGLNRPTIIFWLTYRLNERALAE
jgi:hypothetical protein